MKAKLRINIDCKPSFIRIPKGAEVEIVKEDLPNHYVMVEYQGMFLPVPKTSLNLKK